jgi:hypothetical protein
MANNGFFYGYTGPPFNFLGHMSLTQQQAFNAWVRAREKNFAAIQQHYQIRAEQLRKTAGALEQFYRRSTMRSSRRLFTKNRGSPESRARSIIPTATTSFP